MLPRQIARLVPIALIVLLVLTGCQPRIESRVLTRDQALSWRDAIEVEILEVYDGLEYREYASDPGITFLIEVRIVGGHTDLIGTVVTLPYDRFAVGGAPPAPGTVVMISPDIWVTRRSDVYGTPDRRSRY